MNELEKQEAPRGFYTSHSFSFKYAASDLSAFVAAAGAPLFLSDAGKLEEGDSCYCSMEHDFYRDSCPQVEGTIRATVIFSSLFSLVL